MKDFYIKKDQDYFVNARYDLISLLPKNSDQKILEIGSGGGSTLVAIKQAKLAQEVVGVDLFEIENSKQKDESIDRFIVANLETDILDLPLEYFDTIIAGDVLEHLVDPWRVVCELNRFLKKGGIFIVSVPNIREINTVSKIVFKGTFSYDIEGGIMDKTHLRFFCKKNVKGLFNEDDFYFKDVLSILNITSKKSFRAMFNKITLGIFEEFLTPQYIGIAQKEVI